MSDKQPPPRGYIDPNFPNPGGPNDATIVIYGYTPSLVVALLGAILFALSSAAHGLLLLRYRTWYFIPVLVGCLMEVVGYIARALSSQQDPYSVPYFVVQYFFIVVAPVFFSASIYTILSILISAVGKSYSPISPRAILWIFITCDIIATGIQIGGAANVGVAESNRKDPEPANNALLGGLAFQCFDFLLFLLLLALFIRRSRHLLLSPTPPSHPRRNFTAALLASALLIYLRTAFRLAETADGLYGYLSTHEVFFGCLEFAPVVVAVWVLAWWHPGRWVAVFEGEGGGGGDGVERENSEGRGSEMREA